MPSAAALQKEMASELSGIEGGERQLCAGLQVRVAELVAERKRLRAALKPFANWAMHPSKKPTIEDCNRAFRALKE